MLDFVTMVVNHRWPEHEGGLPCRTREAMRHAVHRTLVDSPEMAPRVLSALYALP